MKQSIVLLILLLFISCDKDKTNTTVENERLYSFEDGFEVSNNNLNELFPANGNRWTTLQQINPTGTTNEITVVNNPTVNGDNALRILSNTSNAILSKMDIEKGGFQAFSGDTVTIKANFYITSTGSISDLFLIDLECCSCWDPNVDTTSSPDSDNQCPGVRLKITAENDFLVIERGKISETTLSQNNVVFPRNEWVAIEWSMTLSDQQSGANTLKINGSEVISTSGTNLPNPDTFASIFAENGIDFTLQQPVFYERVQVGATANPAGDTVELFVDDFSITIK